MNEKELAETLKYSNPKELYIVTWNNLLKKLFCPFKVLVLEHIGGFRKGQVVWVDGIKVTIELKTVYIIKGQLYYHYHFDILIEE